MDDKIDEKELATQEIDQEIGIATIKLIIGLSLIVFSILTGMIVCFKVFSLPDSGVFFTILCDVILVIFGFIFIVDLVEKKEMSFIIKCYMNKDLEISKRIKSNSYLR